MFHGTHSRRGQQIRAAANNNRAAARRRREADEHREADPIRSGDESDPGLRDLRLREERSAQEFQRRFEWSEEFLGRVRGADNPEIVECTGYREEWFLALYDRDLDSSTFAKLDKVLYVQSGSNLSAVPEVGPTQIIEGEWRYAPRRPFPDAWQGRRGVELFDAINQSLGTSLQVSGEAASPLNYHCWPHRLRVDPLDQTAMDCLVPALREAIHVKKKMSLAALEKRGLFSGLLGCFVSRRKPAEMPDPGTAREDGPAAKLSHDTR